MRSKKTTRARGKKMRIIRRNVARGRLGRAPVQPVHYFKRTLYAKAGRTSSTAADTFFGVQFTLNDVPNATEFTNLYDMYCIKAVKYTLIPRASETDTTQQVNPNIGSVIDYDDAGAPGSIDVMTQYQNFKLTRGNKIHSRYFKPAVAQEVYGTSLLTGYSAKKNVWLDCDNIVVPHYAFKGFIQQTSVAVSFDVKIDYYLAFKNVR